MRGCGLAVSGVSVGLVRQLGTGLADSDISGSVGGAGTVNM